MQTETAAAMVALPDDLLAGVFGRLPARSLAASRGVCKPWRDLIDERQLLVRFQRLLPHSVRGLFINYQNYRRPHFLSRPTPASSLEADGGPQRIDLIDGKFDFIEREYPYSSCEVVDHCNGLVLFLDKHANVLHVCNPTTRWSAPRPPCPVCAACHYSDFACGSHRAFLVFDPFVSPEYKVVLSPEEPGKKQQMENYNACSLMEWLPSEWTTWHEFSSNTWRWEEKVFIQEGPAAGTAGELLFDGWGFHHVEHQCRYAVYWQGALYIHCRGEYVSRFSLLEDKYRVIKSPIELAECKIDDVRTFLGRSENGVYIAAIAEKGSTILRVWTLSKSGGHLEWVPKDQSNLEINTYFRRVENNEFNEPKYWILDLELEDWMFNLHYRIQHEHVSLEPKCLLKFLGFHPYKEVIFLCCNGNALAFHLNSSKVWYLGTVHLGGTYCGGIRESFVYTPSIIGD